MKKIRNILSLALVFMMLVALMPMDVFAAEYNITIESSAGGSVTANPNPAEQGKKVKLTINPDENYELDTINVTYGENDSVTVSNGDNDNERTFQMPAGNVTVKATFKKLPTYTVKFDANGEGTAPAAQTVTSGQKATEPDAPTADGFTFGGWYTDKECTKKYDFNTLVTDNIILYAEWTKVTTPTKHTVTFDPNEHGTAPAVQTVTHGEKAKEPKAPTAEGYVFGGWYTEKECTNKYNFTTPVTGNITLYAKWTKVITPTPSSYDVDLVTYAHGTASVSKSLADKGDTIYVTAYPDRGYVVDSIYVKNESTGTYVPLNNYYYNRFYDDDDYYRYYYNRYYYNKYYDDDYYRYYDDDDYYYYYYYNRYYYDKCYFTMPASDVTVYVTFRKGSYYDDYYRPHRPHRPYRPYKPVEVEEKTEEKPIDKPANKVETEVILTIGSNNLDTRINDIDSFKSMDVAPYIKGGRTMLPIRYVAEALGMSVSWDAKTRTVIISDMFYTVEIPVDTNKIIVNGNVYTSDVKPEIKNNRTMLPIANIARALGLKDGSDILWDAIKKQVTIIRIYDK